MPTKTQNRPRPRARPPKAGVRVGKVLGMGIKHTVKGTTKFTTKRVRIARERKKARNENRDTAHPTLLARAKTRFANRFTPACLACGARLQRGAEAGHVCGESRADQSARAAKAHLDAQAAKAAKREENKTNGGRLTRAKARVTGQSAKCPTCGKRLIPAEFHTHQCAQPTPQTPTAPPPKPSPSTAPPKGTPVANGNGNTASLTEVPATHEEMKAAMIAAKMEYMALAQKFEESMLNLRRRAMAIDHFATDMIQGTVENGRRVRRFNPACVQPLEAASTVMRESAMKVQQAGDLVADAAGKFVDVYMMIEKIYADQIAALRAGVGPGEEYLKGA